MNVMKIAGKQTSSIDEVTTNITPTNGMMYVDGTIVSSSSYVYSQKIPVNEGDIVVFNTNPSSSGTIAKLTAFNGDSAVSSDGIGSAQVLNYTVPKSINFIVLSFSSTLSSRSPFVKITRENATVKAIKVDEEGKLFVVPKREWSQTQLVILDANQIRDTNAITAKPESNDVSSFAYISFRIINSLDAEISIQFYDDWHVTGGSILKDINGNTIEITVPAKVNATQNIVVTPDDIPILNLLHYLTLRVQAKTVPTSGSLSITAYGRK